MLLTGTVVADSRTIHEDGGVVDGNEIAFVGDAEAARERYPDHERRSFDIVAPGLVRAHVHSVQSLGRGIADDTALLEWLFDHVLPMETGLDAAVWRVAYPTAIHSDHMSDANVSNPLGRDLDRGILVYLVMVGVIWASLATVLLSQAVSLSLAGLVGVGTGLVVFVVMLAVV